MDVLILNRSGQRCPRQFLEQWVRDVKRALAKEAPGLWKGKNLVLQFLDPKEIRKINNNYRGKDYPTDVLSFGGADFDSLGELALCPQVISAQAVEHGLPYRQELGYVVLHGILHLLGFEHEASKAKARQMFGIQDRVFEKLCHKWWPRS